MEDIFIRKVQAPLSMRAMTILDENGDYNIYINQDLSPAALENAMRHEMLHIKRGDFFKYNTAVEEIENEVYEVLENDK